MYAPRRSSCASGLERTGNIAMAIKAIITLGSTDLLRLERATLLARYDSGAFSPAIFKVIREIETDIAWIEHRQEARP